MPISNEDLRKIRRQTITRIKESFSNGRIHNAIQDLSGNRISMDEAISVIFSELDKIQKEGLSRVKRMRCCKDRRLQCNPLKRPAEFCMGCGG